MESDMKMESDKNSELTVVEISNVNLRVHIRKDPEKCGPHIKEALEIIERIKTEMGPSLILEQLGLVLAGSIESVEILGKGPATGPTALVPNLELGNYVLPFAPFRGKTLSECDLNGLKYLVQMSHTLDMTPDDRNAIEQWIRQQDANPIDRMGTQQTVSFDDDDIPF